MRDGVALAGKPGLTARRQSNRRKSLVVEKGRMHGFGQTDQRGGERLEGLGKPKGIGGAVAIRSARGRRRLAGPLHFRGD